ncbi:DUF4435 domain-containing protein [Microvirga makkahensis]|uniref:DUF4435 domain-containing protein n=1 Tax=Microvirga makkahensis TaxID=1128670 RepID=A0A7X3MVZ6_9HYPH|nr:DUF4435 domain-containing protein [Microvirga makkahensis]MXQ13975.1 DUF4435 domain-containing protein [Microvirga makkahensis]
MPKRELTVDEAVQTLKRSNLPSVVTEGIDDYVIFRRIEEEFSSANVSFLPVGGRGKVLDIFDRRKEIGRNDVIFVVDRDMWVLSSPPPEYTHRKIIMTDGYSIENDLYRDGKIEKLLTNSERELFKSELAQIIAWYSFAVTPAGSKASISDHPGKVLSEDGNLCKKYLAEISYTGPDTEIYPQISSDYERLLRGKTLMAVLLRQLSASSRTVKFSKAQLMEMASAERGPYYTNIRNQIELMFGQLGVVCTV